MIHECKVFCHSLESNLMDLIGKGDDTIGKWLPFAFDISLVDAAKMTTDDEESMVYKCTTVFLHSGDTYIIDTKYRDFIELWKQSDSLMFGDDGGSGDDDLEL